KIMNLLPFRSDRLWIITEADRSVTTLLLPEEYSAGPAEQTRGCSSDDRSYAWHSLAATGPPASAGPPTTCRLRDLIDMTNRTYTFLTALIAVICGFVIIRSFLFADSLSVRNDLVQGFFVGAGLGVVAVEI